MLSLTAILIAGQPRFTKDFTDLIHNLKGSTLYHWHICLWDKNPKPDKELDNRLELIHPLMREPTEQQIRKLFRKHLPGHHSIATVRIMPCEPPPYPQFTPYNCKTQSVWNQWWGWYCIKQQLAEWENKYGKYDCVIKARPDIGLIKPLDLTDCNLNEITTSNNGQHGYKGWAMNDLIGISNSDNMHTWLDVINHAEKYKNSGCVFHPETMLAWHLKKENKITVKEAGWSLSFRTPDSNDPLRSDWGTWIPECP